MKIKYGMFCLAVWMLTLSVILSAVCAFAQEESEPADSAQSTVGTEASSDQSEENSDIGITDQPELSESDNTDATETDSTAVSDSPVSDTPATDTPVTDAPVTDPPVTTPEPVTTVKPVTTAKPSTSAVTTTGVTTTNNRSTEAPILTGVGQTSGYYPLSTGSLLLPTTEAAVSTQPPAANDPVETVLENVSDTGTLPAVSEGESASASPDQSTAPSRATVQSVTGVESDGEASIDGGSILMLALIFGGTCIGAAALLVFLKVKNQSIV